MCWTGQGVRMVDRQSTSSAYPAHLRVSSDRHQFRRNVRKNTEPAVLTIMNDDSGQAISKKWRKCRKHDTYPPSPQKWSLSSLMGSLTRERERSPLRLRLPLTILPVLMRRNFRQQ